MNITSFAPENLVSRDGFGSPVPPQLAHLHTQAESGLGSFVADGLPGIRCCEGFHPTTQVFETLFVVFLSEIDWDFMILSHQIRRYSYDVQL